MLWGKKEDELPAELKGLTPEQIVQKLQEASTLKTQVEALTNDKTALEGQVATHNSELTQLRTKVGELEANSQPPDPRKQDDPPTIWSDPNKFIDERTKQTQNVALMSGMMSAQMYAKNGLSGDDLKIWNKYEKDILQTMNGFTPEQRVLPQSWLMALNLVKGQKFSEIAEHKSKGTDFFAEGASHGQPPSTPDEVKLTPQEEEVCEKFHYDKKRYLENKKKMVVSASSNGGYAHFGA